MNKEFKEEAWKEIDLSLESLEPLKELSPAIKKVIDEHQSVTRNYLSHLTK